MIAPVVIPVDLVAVGTCGLCWGPVCRPAISEPGRPAKLSCLVCNAVPRPMYGAVMPMMDLTETAPT